MQQAMNSGALSIIVNREVLLQHNGTVSIVILGGVFVTALVVMQGQRSPPRQVSYALDERRGRIAAGESSSSCR